MKELSNLESFIRSAEAGSFSAAARRMGLTPAAVSRNVARLEGQLGLRLFHRSTRHLTLSESGERFLREASVGMETLERAWANASIAVNQPSGVLKVSMAPSFGADYIVPLLPEFLTRFPAVVPDLHLENRPVDLIQEGFDAAIGGGFELPSGIVARELARAHVIAVAAPSYIARAGRPLSPRDLKQHDGILLRSPSSGRIRSWPLANRSGERAPVELRTRILINDPESVCRCAILGMGIAFVATLNTVQHLRNGALVRVLPDWYADIGPISLYFSARRQLPAKTRAFVDYIVAECRRRDLSGLLSANNSYRSPAREVKS
jgi:DNA-binding transcriptional LysR family regulator